MRSMLIFGNGVGMALDAEYFSLETALRNVWLGTQNFDKKYKNLVISAIPGLSNEKFPASEEQLDNLQVAIVASQFLKKLEDQTTKWLDDDARELPFAFKRFIHEVATYFHKSKISLPEHFASSLADYIGETASHVAVLNYDCLLYDALRDKEILTGYKGRLIDGFKREGFAPKNLDRLSPKKHGWYLHLHGSPLFVENRKLMRGERQDILPNQESHIVLTHVIHKPLIIASSDILTEYWRRFKIGLEESEKIVVFGYSGEDTHLNEALTTTCQNTPIHIIEWSGPALQEDRQRFWKAKLAGCNPKLHRLEHVLDFTAWADL